MYDIATSEMYGQLIIAGDGCIKRDSRLADTLISPQELFKILSRFQYTLSTKLIINGHQVINLTLLDDNPGIQAMPGKLRIDQAPASQDSQ